ncbi:MAG: hypothetical protein O7F76_10405, partial [Planctomycetota bacterium]|nr:hypothetical protein [Planctomycetota bacterium]
MTRRAHAGLVLLAAVASVAASNSSSLAETPAEVRAIIVSRVGGLDALRVPATDADMPQPNDPLFRITPEKKRLGKMLFFDPIRTNNIRTEFGGVTILSQTSSCGSCHIGPAASKAGQVVSIGNGGQGRGTTDPITGRFAARRQPFADLVDLLPTPLDVRDAAGTLTMSGRFDAVDGPGRAVPSVIGFATNTRLFWGGVAGEPYDPGNPAKANANPGNLPTGENLVELTMLGHRMFGTQRFAMQTNSVYMELFADAFPEEYAVKLASRNFDDLCNDGTIGRAIAAFLRTVITRNTPFDRFLAGFDGALTTRQLRGARLFFDTTANGGANCVSCHSGPALNKVLGDEAGLLVEENFQNVGIGDHPLQELARQTLGDPSIRDVGRQGATGDAAHAFKFKSPTLRQMRDAAPFMHSGELQTLREVVEYFNNGVPASADAAAAGNLSADFTNPRGPGETGLGLSEADIEALVDFLENGLYDPAFVTHDPTSTTETFELNESDLTYSSRLRDLGAVDGRVPSGLHHPQTDALSIQDMTTTTPGDCGFIDLFSVLGIAAPLTLMSARRRMRRRAPA